MREIFIISQSNDRRYNLTWWTVAFVSILIPVISIGLDIYAKSPKLFTALTLIGLVSLYIIRYFFNDQINIGKLIISDKQISIISDNTTKTLSNINAIDFRYEGYFGSSTVIGRFASKDGTGNIVSIKYDDNVTETLNIFLDDREKKEDLVKMLKLFCSKNSIKLDLGLLVSV